ncbi:hypothetical protein ESB00_13800 [Oleiharenicola lentus]|uniref:Uncharacterized protein n=1 Tax=Oleiharenicola lentus TaxID=2508720 RepID=A0A4Q1C386_9BACT|nr:hypothetical protein [Oleiharenicola lentus]RXK52790.1 hypothetical protein ESB00_13800 [Oleiharenicola lentus]
METTAKLGLILLALTVISRAEDTPAAAQPSSESTSAAVIAVPVRPAVPERASLLPGLPTYAPPPPAAPKQLDQPNTPTDPDVLVLPKMTVKQKPRPRLNADIVYASKDLGNVLAKQKYTQLDQALNKFTLPLFGQSLAERAIEDHKREKKQALTDDVLNISNALKDADPAEAKSLEKAITMP